MKKKILPLLLGLVILLCSCAEQAGADVTQAQTKEITDSVTNPVTDSEENMIQDEMRGVWLASVWCIDYPSKQGLSAADLKREADKIIKTVKDTGLNTVFFQVRPMSDALYDSKIFPTSHWLTGKQGAPLPDGFDPLEYMVSACHEQGLELHAWVNPLRITNGTASSPKINFEDLAENNPARLHPEWVVTYAESNLCYNAGLPEVRQLISDGVREIVENYDVDGVIFDDYFYPYVINKMPFEDSETFEKYGEGYDSLADWRRDNINKIVKDVYDTVKSVDPELKFGVGPCGVWQNNDGRNGGSDTKGFEAYNVIYCDSLAWIKGGYIDYIAPQIYWTHDSAEAPFYILARWWDMQTRGTDVKLYISQASYKYADWKMPGEMTKQITNARKLPTFAGSIFYNYSSIEENFGGLADELKELYTK